jgi:hypothetical protein
MVVRSTRKLWAKQDWNRGAHHRLFSAVASDITANAVLYPGSALDIAASFVFPSVIYIDIDRQAAVFFADESEITEIISEQKGAPEEPEFAFVHGNYTARLPLQEGAFDLVVSLGSGFVSTHCTKYLRIGGHLLVDFKDRDAAMASLSDSLELDAVVLEQRKAYSLSRDDLGKYLQPRDEVVVTRDLLFDKPEKLAYTKTAVAYLFRRVK